MKMIIRVVIFVFLMSAIFGCSATHNDDNNTYENKLFVSAASRSRMLKNLAIALNPSANWARINYHSACYKGDDGDLIFPVVNTQAPINKGRGLESVREVFRDDQSVTVTEDSRGVVQISIGHVSGAILDTKIPMFKLDQRAQFNPGGLVGAIPAIEQSPEYEAAFERLGLGQATILYSGGIQPPLESLPHLPDTLKDVTVNDAYDLIAKTFRGVVVYGECTEPGGKILVDTIFYPLD